MTEKKSDIDSNLTASVNTEIIGKLAVGNYIIKIGSSHGAIADLATTQEQPTVQEYSTPVSIRQPPLDNLLERRELIKEAIATLQSGQSVEFYSPVGFGKTALLRYLAEELQANSAFADGVISLSSIHPDVDDLLQSIWDVFYTSDISYKPTNQQVWQQIQDKQALLVLDDDQLIQDEVKELRNAASRCTILLASSNQRIHKQARSIMLSGLSLQNALVLIQQDLQRSLRLEEGSVAKSLCTILKGHPMYLRLAIAYMLVEERSLSEIVDQLPTSEPGKHLIQQILESLTQAQRSILDVLAVMGDAGLSTEQIVAITQLPESNLENLFRLRLIQQEGSRYSLSKTIREVLPPVWKLTAPLESAIAYFTNWADQHQKQPEILCSEIDAIVQILEIAVKASRWQDVWRLVKATEGSLALSKRWGLWGQVLQRGLQASQAQKDKAAQAWTLHQLGTRALCLEENSTAIDYLTQAIELRVSLGDETAVAATSHNINFLPLKPPSLSVSQPQNLQNGKTNNSQQQIDQQSATIPQPTKPAQATVSRSTSDSKNTHQSTVKKPLMSKDTNTKPQSSSLALTRITIVANNASSSHKFYLSNFLPSPKAIITTGILVSGGLLAWHHRGYFTAPSTQPLTTQPKATTKPSAITKPKTAKPSVLDQPIPSVTTTLSPLVESAPIIDPALTPTFPEAPLRHQHSNSEATSAQPLKYSPIPSATPQSTPTPEATPTPSFTPTVPPLFESSTLETEPTQTVTPTPESTPQPTTQTFTPSSIFVPTPKAEIIPTAPAVTATPIKESFNQQ